MVRWSHPLNRNHQFFQSETCLIQYIVFLRLKKKRFVDIIMPDANFNICKSFEELLWLEVEGVSDEAGGGLRGSLSLGWGNARFSRQPVIQV